MLITSMATRFFESICFCHATPSHTALQSDLGYTCAWLARPLMSFTWRWCSASGNPWLQHLLSRRRATSGEFVIMDVGFFTSPTPSSSFEHIPKAHISVLTVSTPAIFETFTTSAIFQELAVLGYSNKK